MKIKKKILSIFMSFLMFVSLFTTVPVQAESDTKMFDIDTPTSVEAGEEFEVKFYVNPDGEMAAFQGSLEYDKDAFEYESYEESDYSGLTLYKEKIVATFEPKTMIFAVASLQAKTMPLNGKNDYFYSFKFKAKDTQGKINTSKFNLKIKEYVKSDGQKLGENISVEKTVNFTTPLTGIALNESSFELVKGKEKQLTVSKVPTYATGEIDGSKVQWKSDATDIATVENGKVVAKKEGTATITATYGEYSATSKVTVKEIHIEKISLSKEALTINKGSTESLTCTIDPKNTTDDKIVTWSSSKPSVVSVDENGQIKALSKGEAIITAKVGSLKATCTVKVTVPLTGITLSATQQQVNVNGTTQLTVTYDPEDASSTDVKYSSNKENVTTVDDNGLVTAHARGTATIKATVDGKEATIEITVVQPLTSIELDKEDQTIYKNNTVQFDVNENPKEHDETVTKKEWKSSDDKIATVENGKVTALKEGNAVITVTYTIGDRTLTASRTVHVKENRVKTVTLDNTNIELNKGEQSDKLNATYELEVPGEKSTDDTTVKWTTSNDKVATVEDGVVTAVGAGEATITATIAGKKATCTVKVNVPLKSIEIEGKEKELYLDETTDLTVKYNPTDTTVEKNVTWESLTPEVATVKDGKVTAVKKGTATIKATVDGKEATYDITVKQHAKEIVVSKDELTLLQGKEDTVTAKIDPANHDDGNATITWKSSDDKIATVKGGTVKAVKEGTATITVEAAFENGRKLTKEISVIVKANHIKTVSLDQTNIELNKGDKSSQLKTSYTLDYPEEKCDDDTTVKWTTSNDKVATVEDGVVTAVGAGEATITATIAGKKATCTVKVSVPLTGISIKASSNEVIKGKTISLSLSKDPSDSTDTIDSISYVIAEGNEFIKVDNDGKVTGLKEGTAKVYAIAKVGSKEFISKEITINVKEIKITSLDVNVDDKILIGKTAQATATVKPSDTTDDQSVTWSSSDESIATVDQNGVVKALKVGKVKVIATSKVRNDVVGEKEITIYDIPVDSITVENKKVSLTRGETFTNSYTINPSDTTDKGTVTYSSSNEEVATVDQTGKVTALKPGKTTITIQSTERKVSTTYTVDVSNPITVEISGSKDASISNKYKDDILNALPEKTKELINTDAVDVVISIESASIEDEETLNTAHKLLEQVKSTKDYQLGQLFDINLTVKVLKDGQVVSQDTISELNNKIVFALQLPKELINTNSNIRRTYKVVRIHENGQTVEEITNVQLSDDGTSLLIPSDKYSLYAVYYQDTVVENKTEQVNPSTTESVKNDTKQNTHKKQDKKSTKTGDESNTVAYLSMMAASILILLVFCIQKRRTLIK